MSQVDGVEVRWMDVHRLHFHRTYTRIHMRPVRGMARHDQYTAERSQAVRACMYKNSIRVLSRTEFRCAIDQLGHARA